MSENDDGAASEAPVSLNKSVCVCVNGLTDDMLNVNVNVNGNECQQLHLSSFLRDVNYSCGSCGYELNLNSSNRNTSVIDSKYGKSIKRGLISFFSIDESRFTQLHQLRWIPFFNPNRSWPCPLFKPRTKLLCRNCGHHIGYAYTSPSHSWDGISGSRIYHVKLTTLQPSFYQDSNHFASF